MCGLVWKKSLVSLENSQVVSLENPHAVRITAELLYVKQRLELDCQINTLQMITMKTKKQNTID